jgi:hypothetical protein
MNNNSKTLFLVAGVAVLSFVVALGFLYSRTSMSHSRQGDVALRGAEVMPFNLDKTKHIFEHLANGGLQTVVARDPSDKEQIGLIQAHLKDEAEKFSRGDFSDPARIHGENMPGLADLKAGAAKIEIRYAALSNGAQIRYTTSNPELVRALHLWFIAQVSDHGKHAVAH